MAHDKLAIDAATKVFGSLAVGPNKDKTATQYLEQCRAYFASLVARNEKISAEKCQEIVNTTVATISSEVSAQKFKNFNAYSIRVSELTAECGKACLKLGPGGAGVGRYVLPFSLSFPQPWFYWRFFFLFFLFFFVAQLVADRLEQVEKTVQSQFKLTEEEKKHREAEQQFEKNLSEQRQAMEAAKAKHAEETNAMNQSLQLQQRLLEEEAKKFRESEARFNAVMEEHKLEVKRLRESGQEEIARVKEKNQADLAELRAEMEAKHQRVTQSQNEKIQELTVQARNNEETLRKAIEEAKAETAKQAKEFNEKQKKFEENQEKSQKSDNSCSRVGYPILVVDQWGFTHLMLV